MGLTRVYNYVVIRGRPYLMIPVTIRARYKAKLYALVDSGAVISLFHNQVADDVGIDLSSCRREYLAGIGGYVPAYIVNNVLVEIEGLREIRIPIAFTECISSDLAILGRKGFFEKFKIVFREWRKELELRIID